MFFFSCIGFVLPWFDNRRAAACARVQLWSSRSNYLLTSLTFYSSWQRYANLSSSADAFDTEQLLHCAKTLKSGQPYQVPIYDFKTHQRRTDAFRQVPYLNFTGISSNLMYNVLILISVGTLYQVNASDVIILEGILVFHDPRVRNLMNMKIFVDTG